MYERISSRSPCARRCCCWLLAADARSSSAAGASQERDAWRHCASELASYCSTTPCSAWSIATTAARTSKAAALTVAERALSVFADLRRALATKNSASVAPIAAAPSADTRITRATTLRSDERFDDRSQILRVERFPDECVGTGGERGPLVLGALPGGDDDHRDRPVPSLRTQLGEELETTLARQHYIQNYRLRLRFLEHFLRLLDVFGLHVAVSVAEHSLDELPQRQFVVANQNEGPQRRRCHRHPLNRKSRISRRGERSLAVTVNVP